MEAILANLLGWSLQVTVVVAAAAVAARTLRVDSASVRHAWWRTVLVVCLALPVLQPWQSAAISTRVAIENGGPLHNLDPSVIDSGHRASLLRRVMAAAPSWYAVIPGVLATGILVRLAWLAAGLVRLRRLRRLGIPAPRFSTGDVRDLADAGADVRYVDEVGQPVTFGIRHPVVLLPSTLRDLPEPVQHAVLAHELWHVRRRDWAWVVAEEALRATLWFHPAMWWLISRIQASREEVVDELTLLLTGSRRHYLEALLAFADQPPLFAAAPFARRQHLYQRMLLLSKEAVMSSRRIVASCAGMSLVLALAGWYGIAAFPLQAAPTSRPAQLTQSAPRDPRPGAARPATAREDQLKAALLSAPGDLALSAELAKLQEERGALSDAESTLKAISRAHPTDGGAYHALAAFYQRTAQFDRAIATMQDAAAADPSNPAGYQIVATYYWEKVRRDETLTPTERMTYITEGIAETDRALALQPDLIESLVYKNIFLRMQANLESDPAKQQALITQADALRNQALALQKTKRPEKAVDPKAVGYPAPPPPPPPPPPLSQDEWAAQALVDGKTPMRVGGSVAAPSKTYDVNAKYPEVAMQAGVQGVVIVDAVIDGNGSVAATRVVRSIPLLDQAALDAVKQWKFTPTLLNGAPTPVVVTMTVNFTLK